MGTSPRKITSKLSCQIVPKSSVNSHPQTGPTNSSNVETLTQLVSSNPKTAPEKQTSDLNLDPKHSLTAASPTAPSWNTKKPIAELEELKTRINTSLIYCTDKAIYETSNFKIPYADFLELSKLDTKYTMNTPNFNQIKKDFALAKAKNPVRVIKYRGSELNEEPNQLEHVDPNDEITTQIIKFHSEGKALEAYDLIKVRFLL